jgi:sugar/nucleoside kinase (ribokinase family)
MTPRTQLEAAAGTPSVLVIGGLFLEVVFGDIGGLPRPGTEVFSSSFGISWGGAVTVAVAVRRGGASVGLVAPLGEDLTSAVIEQFCARAGIDVSVAKRVPGVASGVTVALNYQQDRALVSYHPERVGGGRHSAGWWVDAVRRARPQWVYLHAGPEAVPVVAEAHALGCRVAVDVDLMTVTQHRGAVLECLRHADLFLPNEQEMLLLAGDGGFGTAVSLDDAVLSVLSLCGTVVVKRGRAGALIARQGTLQRVSDGLADVEVLDRTGAGDSFAGALIAELVAGQPLEAAVAAGNAAGSLAVGRLGAVGALQPDGTGLRGPLPDSTVARIVGSLHELGRPSVPAGGDRRP